MDISKFKDVILNVVKTHSSLLVPVVIGLVGGLLFIPAVLMSSKLKKQMAEESISKRGRQIGLLSSNAVARDQWKEEQKYQDKHREDANEIELLARQSTQRELLSYEIFPAPKDDSMSLYQEFGQQFRGAVDKLMARINAGGCPTQAELEKSLQSSLGSRSPSHWDGGMGVPSSSSYGRLGGARDEIIDALCQARAESASIYANPVGVGGYEFWVKYDYEGMDEAVKDCWYYQLGYWIIEDVIDTIDAMNSGSDSVFTSSVKRLLGMWFAPTDELARGDVGSIIATSRYTGREVVTRDRPSYVRSIRDGLTRGDVCTGRICNDDIDVVHFNIAVVVSAKSVLPFMQELCSAKQHKFKGWDGKEFEVKLEFQSDLDNGIVSEELRKEFEGKDTPLSQDATISVEQAGSRWQITDKLKKKKYTVRKEQDTLKIYVHFKHNQITILESEIALVAQGGGEYEGARGIPAYGEGSGAYGYEGRGIHNLYRYGEDAVVELELVCEYIFNKKGYDEIEPELVKKVESQTTSSR